MVQALNRGERDAFGVYRGDVFVVRAQIKSRFEILRSGAEMASAGVLLELPLANRQCTDFLQHLAGVYWFEVVFGVAI